MYAIVSTFVLNFFNFSTLVVSTVASGILFAHFPTVECIAKVEAFYVMTS